MARRRQILDAAQAAFADFGFNAASLRDIASRVGISHQAVSHHYPDKGAILIALLEDRLAHAAEDFLLEAEDGLQYFLGLLAVIERDAVQPDGTRFFYIMSAEASTPTHPAHQFYVDFYREVRARNLAALRDLQRQGRYVGAVPLEVAAIQLSAMRDGLTYQYVLEPGCFDLAAMIRQQLELYISLD